MAQPTLVLTRPRASAQGFADGLDPRALDLVRLIFAPLMEIEATGAPLDLHGAGGVIFTSANGVRHAPRGQGRAAFCVGAQTRTAAEARGWIAVQAGETAAELVETLKTTRPRPPLVHLGGEHTRGDIAARLTQAGIATRHIAIYAQNLLPLGDGVRQALRSPCILPVFSPRSAGQLVNEAAGCLEMAHVIALSPSVTVPLCGEKTAQMHVLPVPRAEYMRKAVEKLCFDLSAP